MRYSSLVHPQSVAEIIHENRVMIKVIVHGCFARGESISKSRLYAQLTNLKIKTFANDCVSLARRLGPIRRQLTLQSGSKALVVYR